MTRIDWQGGVCGPPQGFVQRVARRTDHVRFVERKEGLRLRVEIERHTEAFDATVTFSALGRATVKRSITSPDCDDALDALALVVAIGIDERWREAAAKPRPVARARRPAAAAVVVAPAAPPADAAELPQSPAAPAEPPAAVPPPAEDTAIAPPTEPPPPARPAPPAPPAAASAPPAAVAAPAPAEDGSHFLLALGAAARLLGGAAPEPMLGGELWLRLGWERASVWSPELGVSFSHQRLSDSVQLGSQADFALSAAGMDLCPLRLGTPLLNVRPCAAMGLGQMRVEGHDTFRAQAQTRPWLSLGGEAQAVALLHSVELRLVLGVSHPLVRDSFRFGPSDCVGVECADDVFHRVAAAVWSVGVGAGLSFP